MGFVDIEERAIHFDCAGERLQGVLAVPTEPRSVGVLIVVGGPQYRAGSHRQFVLLSRRLAASGWPVLRFDVRGMGDSSGELVAFDSIAPDIEAAVRALRQTLPGTERVVLWGLCDAASAALMGAAALPDVAGLVLLNPWVRHEETFERTQLKHYYVRRLMEPEFWRKLASGRTALREAVAEFAGKLYRVARGPKPQSEETGRIGTGDFRERMVRALTSFKGPVLFMLSGRDHVAAEFLEFSAAHPKLTGLWSQHRVTRIDLPKADHTFSSPQLRDDVEQATLGWLKSEFDGGRS